MDLKGKFVFIRTTPKAHVFSNYSDNSRGVVRGQVYILKEDMPVAAKEIEITVKG